MRNAGEARCPDGDSAVLDAMKAVIDKEYSQCRITHEHSIHLKDKYIYRGKSISQDAAKEIVQLSRL